MRICDVTFGDNGGSAGSGRDWGTTTTTLIAVSTTGDNSGCAGLVGDGVEVVLLQLLLLFLLLVTMVGLRDWLE